MLKFSCYLTIQECHGYPQGLMFSSLDFSHTVRLGQSKVHKKAFHKTAWDLERWRSRVK